MAIKSLDAGSFDLICTKCGQDASVSIWQRTKSVHGCKEKVTVLKITCKCGNTFEDEF
jgi:hypothetical protein